MWKLAQPAPPSPLLACVAEELALNAIINDAEDAMRDGGREPDFSGFRDVVFQDLDFELLFNDALDGFEDTVAGRAIRLTDIRFGAWFDRFRNSSCAVHPYAH